MSEPANGVSAIGQRRCWSFGFLQPRHNRRVGVLLRKLPEILSALLHRAVEGCLSIAQGLYQFLDAEAVADDGLEWDVMAMGEKSVGIDGHSELDVRQSMCPDCHRSDPHETAIALRREIEKLDSRIDVGSFGIRRRYSSQGISCGVANV
jgi:hypothetical protein